MAFMRNPPEWQAGKHGMYLECPYNEDFLEEMKQVVPGNERHWDGKRRQWWISDTYLDEVDNLLFVYFERIGDGRD